MQSLSEARIAPDGTAPMAAVPATAIFVGGAVLLFFATRLLIPVLGQWTGAEPIVLWFLAGGLGVFAPMLVATFVLLKQEGVFEEGRLSGVWTDRLRFRRMTRRDWAWTLGGLAAIGALSAVLMTLVEQLAGESALRPPFATLEPLDGNRYWILFAWLPFWFLNIMGEEILWHGVLLPRQEAALGRWTWAANGAGWLVFHVPFGWAIVCVVAPVVFIIPYIVQRTGNSWTGVVLHAAVNGGGFLAIAFGAL